MAAGHKIMIAGGLATAMGYVHCGIGAVAHDVAGSSSIARFLDNMGALLFAAAVFVTLAGVIHLDGKG